MPEVAFVFCKLHHRSEVGFDAEGSAVVEMVISCCACDIFCVQRVYVI